MKPLLTFLFATLLLAVACTTPLPPGFAITPVPDAVVGANPMVHQEGRQIVDPQGQPLILRGVLLEGWLQWNGTLWGAGLVSETQIAERLTAMAGPEAFEAFRLGVYDNYITERDIEMIAALGLNVVRVPINHHVLESAAGVVDETAVGWRYLDRLMDWGERHGVYVVLDLHSAPGGQSGVFVADPDSEKLWDSDANEAQTVALWRAIAARYKDREIVAGYDLLNEPGYPDPAALIGLYRRIIVAIREVDPYHMVIIEGNGASTDFTIFDKPLSSNMAYSFHTYNFFTNTVDEEQMQKLNALAAAQDVALWNGEFGAHNAEWVADTIAMFEAPDNQVSGWVFWPWKRVPENPPDRWRHLNAIATTSDWDRVRQAIPFPSDNDPSPETAVNGLNEFLAAIRADALMLDETMKGVIGR